MSKVSRVKTQNQILEDPIRQTPVDRQLGRIRRWLTVACVVLVVAAVAWFSWGP